MTEKELIELAAKETGFNFNRLDDDFKDFLLGQIGYFDYDETGGFPRDKVPAFVTALKEKAEKAKQNISALFSEQVVTKSRTEAPKRVNKTPTFESKDSLLMEWELRSILTAQRVETLEFKTEANESFNLSSWRVEHLDSEQALSEEEAITWLEEQERKQSASSNRFSWLQVDINTDSKSCKMIKVYAKESQLRDLSRLVNKIVDKTEWRESEAVRFILLGHIPFIQPIEVSASRSIPSRRTYIILKVDRSVQPQEVAAYYKKAVQEFSANRAKANSIEEILEQGKNKMQRDKDLPRFKKLIKETPDKTSVERVAIWNKEYPGDQITKYRFEKMGKEYMQIMEPTKSRSRSLDEKTLRLARFVLTTPDETGAERMKEWNSKYLNDKISNPNAFCVALHRVKEKFSVSII